MLIGYARISKADGSQSLDLQRDALIAAGVPVERIYEDQASGARDDRPGLEACLPPLSGKLSPRLMQKVYAEAGGTGRRIGLLT